MKLIKKIFKSEFVKKLIPKLVYLYIKLVLFTSKIEVIFQNFQFAEFADKQLIFACWHNRVIVMPFVNPAKLPSFVIVSDHNDGRLIGDVIKQAGVELVYGSSNKRPLAALKEILQKIKAGMNFLISPDGPRGPAREVKGATINIASNTGLPIIAATYSAKYAKIFNSWDKFILPLPFNKIIIIFAEPIIIPADISAAEKNKFNQILANSLNQITDLADSRVKNYV